MTMKRKRINKDYQTNQTSFYFDDYLETNKKNSSLKKKNYFHDRIYLLFFLFFSLIFIFGIRIIHVSLTKIEISNLDRSPKKI